MSESDFRTNMTRLHERIKKQRVFYEAWSDHLSLQGKRAQDNFVLNLCGNHGQGIDHPSPGCLRCVRIYEVLRPLAKWVVPNEERLFQYEIQTYDQAYRKTTNGSYGLRQC
jgi:hypothetical protein